jgi:hypothetical protein
MNLGYRDVGLFLRTVRCRLTGKADVARWANIGNHEPSWEERTRLIAGLIPPGSRVIEFGAGRMALEGLLDAESRYVPSDLVSRRPGTVVCDLNARPLPDLRSVSPQVAVFAGVLEYLTDVPAVAAWLAGFVDVCIVSYECARSHPGSFHRIRETFTRTWSGWVSTYDEPTLIRVFDEAGFILARKALWVTPDGDEPIFLFERRR